MNTFTNASVPLRLFGVVLALALVAVATLLVTPTSAQSPDNTYDDPEPCGPGAETAFMPEPHEITTGHYALFDAYWEWAPPEGGNAQQSGLEDSNYLHLNECPPTVTTETRTDEETEEEVTVPTYHEAQGDIEEAIFHIKDEEKYNVAVVSTNAEATSGQISLEEYPALHTFVDAGDKVFWLQLDDPDTEADETSDLTIGFSTRNFDDQYWVGPLRYRLSVERHPSAPHHHPHFFAYKAPIAGGTEQGFVWSSAEAGVSVLEMEPGEFKALQWIFTDEGTYEIWVQLIGYVNKDKPGNAGDDWSPISDNITETSEVKRYVFQVGEELAEHEPPRFGFSYTIDENTPPGTEIGEPIQVIIEEPTDLEYSLSGAGADQFALDSTSAPDSVQIRVADGANLDFETKPSYDLLLSVTDNIDHESNPDSSIDHFVAVQVQLRDMPPTPSLVPSNRHLALGETLTLTIVWQEFEELVGSYNWSLTDIFDEVHASGTLSENNVVIWTETHQGGHDGVYTLTLEYERTGHSGRITTIIENVKVSWGF